MTNKDIINTIPEIISYSLQSHLLRKQQILKFTYIYIYKKSILDYLSLDIIYHISQLIKRNNWQKTKLLLN
jgi:hypothetical protein